MIGKKSPKRILPKKRLTLQLSLHSCPEALLRIKKITRTETYTGSLYDTWGVLKIFFKTFQLGNFEKSTNLCFPYAKLGAKLEENGHF